MTRAPTLVRHADAVSFLRRAGGWLLAAEAENNLILGVADRLAMGRARGYRTPLYLATLEDEREVVGCAFRTPPFPLGLTRMPPEAVAVLAADVSAVYRHLPGVIGPEGPARLLAERWGGLRGVAPHLAMEQTLYCTRELQEPESPPEGALRPARGSVDTALAVAWMGAFHDEAGVYPHDHEGRARALVEAGDLHFWERDGEPRAAGAVVARTPHGARIGFVYTPPEERGRGYGTALSAALTRTVLAEGARFCFLYADRENPTSNGIYRRLGYEPVCRVVDYRFA